MSKQSEVITKSNSGSFQRLLSQKTKRLLWLPKGTKEIKENLYELAGTPFSIYIDNSFTQSISLENPLGFKNILTTNEDKIGSKLNWLIECENTYNPIDRLNNYFEINKLKNKTQKILDNISNFVEDSKNIYDLEIEKIILIDSTLISIKKNIKIYPDNNEIYASIEKLEKYSAQNNAKITNAPMLNIEKIDDYNWSYMVALPINKDLKNANNIIAKRMFSGGKILATENINGGLLTIEKNIKNLENFKTDNNFLSPAISFQSLITDRRLEKDTGKWITKLYYPIY